MIQQVNENTTLNKIEDIIDEDSTKYNTNNYEHDINGNVIDSDEYSKKLDITNYLNFAEYLLEPHIIIPLTKYEISELAILSAASTMLIKVQVNLEDLSDMVERFDKYIPKNDNGYFFRMNRCSPKDAFYGCHIWSGSDIIKTMVSSERCHKNLKWYDQEYIILKPWNNKYEDRKQWEFRCFCYNGKLTAISQYKWHESFDWSMVSLSDWDTIVNNISDFYMKHNKFSDCVIDVYVDPNYKIELVEFNSFGMELASGSALFEWKQDSDILYGNENVEIRIY